MHKTFLIGFHSFLDRTSKICRKACPSNANCLELVEIGGACLSIQRLFFFMPFVKINSLSLIHDDFTRSILPIGKNSVPNIRMQIDGIILTYGAATHISLMNFYCVLLLWPELKMRLHNFPTDLLP